MARPPPRRARARTSLQRASRTKYALELAAHKRGLALALVFAWFGMGARVLVEYLRATSPWIRCGPCRCRLLNLWQNPLQIRLQAPLEARDVVARHDLRLERETRGLG